MKAALLLVLLAAQDPPGLRVLGPDEPRPFFFRSSEGWAANPKIDYARWERDFSRLWGIEGKVLEEEVPGRSARNLDFFTRFKKDHPDQLVLLHFNGNARDPRWQSEEFFAGHWIYYNGTRILEDVPAHEGETDLRVEDARLFRVQTGRYRNRNEDLGLCELDGEGRPDWSRSEQVQLVSIDAPRNVIRVRRGCYGTRPRAFPGGRSYAAAHASEGPWGKNSNLLWFYNHSVRCPRDARGRSCTDVLVEDLARRFAPGGELAAFDGLEFDVLHNECRGGGRGRGLDTDADGKADGGIFDGVNTYGIGVIEFCRRLRAALGERRLILADGHSPRAQRAFGILNGIESEGWPSPDDVEARDWSGGLNRHFFWRDHGRSPAFHYVNHKFTEPGDAPGEVVKPDLPFSTHRLVFAACAFMDAAVCYAFDPPADRTKELIGIWDELAMGSERRPGWLGKALGPPVRLAARHPDLLEGAGNPPGEPFLRRLAGEGVRLSIDGTALRAEAAPSSGARGIRFRLKDVPAEGPDLFVTVTARAAPMRGYPPEYARLLEAALAPPGGEAPPAPPKRDKDAPRERSMTYAGPREFTSGFYFDGVRTPRVDLEIAVEGAEPVWISRVAVHAHPDAIFREYEKGVVLANPSPRPYTFDLAALLPGRIYRRLRGSPEQDPRTNDGSLVEGPVRLGPRDGLFLVRMPSGR